MAISALSSTHRYAAGVLLALALRQAQLHQTHPLGFPSDDPDEDSPSDRSSTTSSRSRDADVTAAASDWTEKSHGLLRPVFRFLEIDDVAWPGIEETAASATSEAKHHIGAYMRLVFQEVEESSERLEQEFVLAKAVDIMAQSMEVSPSSWKHNESEKSGSEVGPESSGVGENGGERKLDEVSGSGVVVERKKDVLEEFGGEMADSPVKYHRKISVLYVLLSACVADMPEDRHRAMRNRKGYDARHRVALRLLATWLDVKWKQMEAIEIMVACSAMAAAKEQVQSQESESPKSKWAKWRRGGIIGAAALTGGALLAITGGLAAPAIAAGFGALAPTLGTLVPVIGAGGFAAVASAAGSVAGSVAVAASFGGGDVA